MVLAAPGLFQILAHAPYIYHMIPGPPPFSPIFIVKWHQFRLEVSVFVWGLGAMGSSGTSGGEEEGVGQDLEQARSF